MAVEDDCNISIEDFMLTSLQQAPVCEKLRSDLLNYKVEDKPRKVTQGKFKKLA